LKTTRAGTDPTITPKTRTAAARKSGGQVFQHDKETNYWGLLNAVDRFIQC
jgi:hypothetical protein